MEEGGVNMEIEPRDVVPPSWIPYNFDAEVKNGNKKAKKPDQANSSVKPEMLTGNRRHPVIGGFMDKYRERYGPNIKYQSGVTNYVIEGGMLWLDGKPIRKIR